MRNLFVVFRYIAEYLVKQVQSVTSVYIVTMSGIYHIVHLAAIVHCAADEFLRLLPYDRRVCRTVY